MPGFCIIHDKVYIMKRKEDVRETNKIKIAAIFAVNQ